MEKSRILFAAAGWLTFLAIAVSVPAQEVSPDTLKEEIPVFPDTSKQVIEQPLPDSIRGDQAEKKELPGSLRARRDSLRTVPAKGDTAAIPARAEPSLYDLRTYLSRGAGDEIKGIPGIFVLTPGTVGTPQIPLEYLNVPGTEITVNGLPFVYNGIYRPYVVGTDLNTIPWEILHDIRHERGKLDFILDLPSNDLSGSDVEVARGPYSYSGTRWRFYQPLGTKTKAYFTVGFNKSGSFYPNTDYDGYHVTGGIRRDMLGGQLRADIWKHRAKTGLLSFDYLVGQLSRQSRGVDRAEASYERSIVSPIGLKVTGMFERSAQTISGYTPEFKSKNDIGGGKADLQYESDKITIGVSSSYFNNRLYGLYGLRPSVNIFDHRLYTVSKAGPFSLSADIDYSWNGIDRDIVLPGSRLEYKMRKSFFAAVSFYKSRRMPDLYLRYFDDDVSNLGYPGVLETYRFQSARGLKSPVTTAASIEVGGSLSGLNVMAALSKKDIKDQIRLAYYLVDPGDHVLYPVNFDDRFIELTAKLDGNIGPFSGELAGAYRKWEDAYFPDGLEKGPAFVGFGRISFLREFFVPRLYFGASVEVQASSRREYRSIQVGLTDSFAIGFARFLFRYKDLTFYFNEDNILQREYYPQWPYPGNPRNFWWGFRWKFLD